MANLTITVDAETLKRARIKAIEKGESVNQVLAETLRVYADGDDDARWRADFERMNEVIARYAGHGSNGARWTREELYAERIDRIVAS